MFAVSENICIFVLPRIAYFTDSRITYKESVYSAGSLSDNSIAVGLRFLAEHSERARPFSFIYTVINFFQKMPRIEKVSSTKVNNSNLSAQPIHKFRIRITSHLTKNPKLCANIFGWTNILSIFVVRQTQKIVFQSKSIHIIPQIKRGFFSAYLLENNRYGFVAKQGNSSAYSFLSLTVNF